MIGRGIAEAVAGVLMVLAGTVRADVFNVSTAQELQSALTQAAGNGVADTINLAAGYYIGNFNYNSAEGFDLTIQTEPGVDKTQVTIDGAGTGRSFNLNCSAAANITVQGITVLRNCGSANNAGLRVACLGDVLVGDCRFMAVNGANGMGVEIAAARDGTVRDCIVNSDGASRGLGISIAGVTRRTEISGNTVRGNSGGDNGGGVFVSVGAHAVVFRANTIVGNSVLSKGAGIHVSADSGSVTIEDNSITDNYIGSGGSYSGGGAYISCNGGSVVLTRNVFSKNRIHGSTLGGGVCVYATGGTLVVQTNTVTGNQGEGWASHRGGGMYLYVQDGTVTITGNTISGNSTASDYTGAGGGLYVYTQTANLELIRNTITQNFCKKVYDDQQTETRGAGVCVEGGGTLRLAENRFSGNWTAGVSGGGGGLCVAGGSTVTLTNNRMTGNRATTGGGMYKTGGGVLVATANTFLQNQAISGSGGGVYAEGNTVSLLNNVLGGNSQAGSGRGGGIWVSTSTLLDMVNNSLTGNSAAGGGGGLAFQVNGVTEVLHVYNNIVWGNTASGDGDDVHLAGTGSRKEFVNNNASGLYGIWDLFTGNIDVAPAFADAANGDYHLTAASLCVNAGTNNAPQLPTTDADGDPRIAGATVDMGAYEFSNTDLHPADVNSNWVLEPSEFTAYSDAWRGGQVWGASSNSIPSDYVTRAGYLKENGGIYHNDGAARPLRWKPGVAP